MPPRTRTSTGTLKRKSTHLDLDVDDSDLDPELDADFLALSRRQRREVDRAYDRALREVGGVGGGKRKKRKVRSTVDESGGGGGGGFVVEEDVEMSDAAGGGGFVPDEEDDGMENLQGDSVGFITNEEHPSTNASPSPPSLLPLSSLPSTITSLGLEWDDDVLAVFQSQSTDQSTGATKRDFRAVCAAMMEAEVEVEGDGEEGEEMEMDSEDEYQGIEQQDDGSESPLSPLSDGYNDEDSTNQQRRRQRPPTSSDPSMRADIPTVKLSRDQKDFISKMWETMFEGSERERGQRLLGREQVKRWAGIMGEMWGDDELTEMIQLFSTQPGKRGLSYEDFTNLLIRGGLV